METPPLAAAAETAPGKPALLSAKSSGSSLFHPFMSLPTPPSTREPSGPLESSPLSRGGRDRTGQAGTARHPRRRGSPSAFPSSPRRRCRPPLPPRRPRRKERQLEHGSCGLPPGDTIASGSTSLEQATPSSGERRAWKRTRVAHNSVGARQATCWLAALRCTNLGTTSACESLA